MARTQDDLVKEHQAVEGYIELVTDKVTLPGLKHLHLKTKKESAETLTMILKMRPKINGIKWDVGKDYIEITYKTT